MGTMNMSVKSNHLYCGFDLSMDKGKNVRRFDKDAALMNIFRFFFHHRVGEIVGEFRQGATRKNSPKIVFVRYDSESVRCIDKVRALWFDDDSIDIDRFVEAVKDAVKEGGGSAVFAIT